MKKIVLSLLLGISSACFALDNSYLFVQNSSRATLSQQQKNSYTITLDAAPAYVGYFTDRPVRQSGAVKLADFLSMWSNKSIKNNFAENPPNVAIVMVNDKGEQQNAMAELTNPHYQNGVLSYQINVLNSQPLQAGKLQHIALFFDDISWNPGGFGR